VSEHLRYTPRHCTTCRCHESPPPVPVRPGDTIMNRLTGQVGIVDSVQEPNPPWHNGGTPFVKVGEKPDGYWHFYDVIESALKTHNKYAGKAACDVRGWEPR
jgi:hypothetical protein